MKCRAVCPGQEGFAPRRREGLRSPASYREPRGGGACAAGSWCSRPGGCVLLDLPALLPAAGVGCVPLPHTRMICYPLKVGPGASALTRGINFKKNVKCQAARLQQRELRAGV